MVMHKILKIDTRRILRVFFQSKISILSSKTNITIYKTERNFISKSYVKKNNLPSKPVEGRIPTVLEQATGIEKLELLKKIAGEEAFDLEPLDASRMGTLKDPIIVKSLEKTRLIGCTGFPADSHNVLWFELSTDRQNSRCPECGNAYKLDFIGTENINNHH
ncbi:hypothetical protein PMAC_002169 [Pneumocystis sp. 'macacae']|nr:hypothetical protein PMAC_002169 [Pneumocystis sp. 'macacae']